MTIKECYAIIGDYEDALARLMKDSLLKRFLGKFTEDKSYESLCTALEKENYEEAFRCAHTLKGVAGNLALTGLAALSSEITEILRDREPHDVNGQMEKLDAEYRKVTDAIRQLD